MNIRTAWTLLFATSIAACGGGGGGSEPPPVTSGIDARGAPRVDVAAKGKVSGFGSVIVNGVRYDTSNTNFDIDGQAGSESDLAVGQVVTVVGSTDDSGGDARADSIEYDDLVEGPVESIDLPGNSLIVLGQTVLVDTDTIFDDDFSPRDITGVSVGQIVEVSGFRNSAQAIRATYIDLDDDSDDFDIYGEVSNVDTAAFTFDIGSLTVDYSNAMLEDFPNGEPENGQTVDVEGTLGSGGVLLATEVSYEDDDLSDLDGDDIEIEGFITRFASATDFDVDGTPVTTTGDTSFENGSAADLALDVLVEVDGEVNAEGVIVAEEIEFEQEANLAFRGIVEATTDTSVTLLGVTATVTAKTDFVDSSSAGLDRFSLADVNVGDYVEVRGFESDGTITLKGLEREDDVGESGVSGPVSDASPPVFVVAGVTVRTSAATEFEDDDDNPIDSATFFANALGNEVEVTGQYANGGLDAAEVEFDTDGND